MQSEIKKRTRIYGAVAVLLAVVLASLCYNLGYMPNFQASAPLFLKTFSSYAELRDFLVANSKTQGTYPFFGPWDTNLRNTFADTYGTPATFNVEYSTTNIQVAGVDEADIVKTDGEYIYVMTGNNVSILKGYPPAEAQLLSKITLNDTYPTGIFASGNRLVVLGCKYTVPSVYYGSYFVDVKTLAKVYDISNRADPQLLRTFTISGNYFNSRMIDKYVYFVVSQPAYVIYDTVILPKIYSDTDFKEISPSEIHYSSASDNYYLFTTFAALNIQDTAEEPTYMALMLGGTSNMYVSLNNIYVTYPELEEKTSIYRIHINNRNLTSEASGKVPGRELNQFSMDEYNDFFRIATTTRMNGITQNNLYVLDMNLSIIGKIEDIATNETIDSVRFIGDRAYLATSVVRRDPFFVMDVENPTDPRILGYLKIPGFTRYLHPYGENHLIGIGRDENNSVKISLFDASNVSAPVEVGKYSVIGEWSDTPVLTEHKALLFDKSGNLLVIPVSIYESSYSKDGPSYWLWQGALIFKVTLSDGFTYRGAVTHQRAEGDYWNQSFWVKREFYIDNVLYTVSDMKLKLNNLQDLAFIKEITLN